MNMSPNDQISATLTRQEWSIIIAGLGELPGKMMFDVGKKIETLLQPPMDRFTAGPTATQDG